MSNIKRGRLFWNEAKTKVSFCEAEDGDVCIRILGDGFEWTDELLRQLVLDAGVAGMIEKNIHPKEFIEKFKASKQPQVRQGISGIDKADRSYPQDKPQPFTYKDGQKSEIQPTRNWEILAFNYEQRDGKYTYTFIIPKEGDKFRICFDLESEEYMLQNKYPIHSVRRISDNTTFTIGETVTYKPVQKIYWQIDNFFVREDGQLLARSKDNQHCEFLDDNLIKSSDLAASSPSSKRNWEIALIENWDFTKPIHENKILSVRRLSDGVVLTIGGKFNTIDIVRLTIESFSITEKGEMLVYYYYDRGGGVTNIDQVKDYTPPSPSSEQPAHTDEAFLKYLVEQKEKCTKEQRLDEAVNWRMVERAFRQYIWEKAKKPMGKFISIEDVVKEWAEKRPEIKFQPVTEESYDGAAKPFFPLEDEVPQTIVDHMNKKRPPIGIMPEWLWREKRLDELNEAIGGYMLAGKEIPQEWINEKFDHGKWLWGNKKSEQPKEERVLHKCKYCGIMTTEPDENCWNKPTEQPKKERVGVYTDGFYSIMGKEADSLRFNVFDCKNPKLEDCRKAIEQVLNDELLPGWVLEMVKPINGLYYDEKGNRLYQKHEVEEAERKAFESGRMFHSFEDYKNSQTKQS